MSEAYGIENGSVQWPFVVAATIFLMEFLLCFLLLLLLRLMLYFKDPGSGEVLFLSRLREVAEMLACISFFSGVYYVFQVCRKHDHDLPMGSASWFRDTREIREGRHMILWTFLAPQQWVMHARLYTKASWREASNLMISTAFTMVFGLCATQVDMSQEHTWIAPHWQVRCFYTLACMCLLTTYVRAHRFPMEPAIAKTGRFYLNVKYVIWSCYPLVYALRSFEIITPWQEEVLCYSALDLVAKSLSLWRMLVHGWWPPWMPREKQDRKFHRATLHAFREYLGTLARVRRPPRHPCHGVGSDLVRAIRTDGSFHRGWPDHGFIKRFRLSSGGRWP